ncbi:hypothetical protein PGT21_028378 [Puccinia graminis f. sp. tritici]|uniref:Uncharacterized protein n=1 Tax=Puccinia graminis f. sp. tritici TaxID=56615 RepID=A0A5B0P905_PUCGR|nr:hypothetical protein PGT21_028378 [Puccinia graminis f. sp. tritici]KAA1108087.1 hypothetical protein PGTUg99_029438 [Puccinia graminis f. sp. tritici]
MADEGGVKNTSSKRMSGSMGQSPQHKRDVSILRTTTLDATSGVSCGAYAASDYIIATLDRSKGWMAYISHHHHQPSPITELPLIPNADINQLQDEK